MLKRLIPLTLGLAIGGIGCGQKPVAPTEEEARAAFYKRDDRLKRVEEAVRKEIAGARLATAPPPCAPPEPACIAVLRTRDEAVKEGQKRLQTAVASVGAVCAEVTVTSRARKSEELAARVATCPPGRRGDSIDPADPAKGKTAGDYLLGRGAYSKADGVMHPGIAVRRELQDGDATTKIEIYFFTDE